jgi:hypothetical protein
MVATTVPGSGELAVRGPEDVRALLPEAYREQEEPPILVAMLEVLAEMALAWQDAGNVAVAESDVGTATAQYLDGLGEDRTVSREKDESVAALQARAQAVPGQVDRLSILAVVGAVLAPLTDVKAQLFDAVLDRMYVSNGEAPWHSFVGAGPSYPDRLYEEDALANGGARPQSSPGGAWVMGDHAGRYFVLRVPDLSGIDLGHAFPGPPGGAPGGRMFLGGTGTSFLALTNVTALVAYQAIADRVSAILGHGVRWKLVVDPTLT